MAAALSLMTIASAAFAAPETFKLDPSHTVVGFQVRHFFSKVPGLFKEFDGTITLDQANWDASSVEATIQAASISTNNEKRDGHLRSADFFDVEKFPTLTFKSTKVTKGEDGKLKVAGDLTIKGVSKPVVLDVDLLGVGAVGIGGSAIGTRAGFEATAKIDRKDYGIVWNKTLDQGGTMLGDDVAINIGVEAIKVEPSAAQAKPAVANTKK
jgi:polyisoprenoid-binding protein YceI